MPSISVRINYSLKALNSESSRGNVAPVRLKNGRDIRLEWKGFVTEEEARCIPLARPVKIIACFVSDDEHGCTNSELQKGQYVQGCALPSGGTYGMCVYGVLKRKKVKLV